MPNVIEELVFAFGYQIDSAALDRAAKAADSNAKQTEKAYKNAAREVELAQKRLAAAVGDAAKETAKAALEAAEESRDAAKAALEDMGRDVDKLDVKFSAKFKNVMTGIGTGIAGAAGLAAGAAASIAAIVDHGIDAAKDSAQWAQRLDETTTAVQRLDIAAQDLNVEQDAWREGAKTLQENLGELARVGGGPAKEALASLGLTLHDFEGLSIEDKLGLIGEALFDIEDPAKRTSAIIQLMGEDGVKLLPVLEQGRAGLHALGDAAEDAGRVMSEDTIASARELDKSLKSLKGEAQATGLVILDALLPVVEDMPDQVSAWVAENDELIKQDLPTVLKAIAQGLTLVAGAAADVVRWVSSAGDSFEGFLEWSGGTDKWLDKLDAANGGRTSTRGDNAFLPGSAEDRRQKGLRERASGVNAANVQAWQTALKAQAQAKGSRESAAMERSEIRFSADAKARTAASGAGSGGGGGKTAEQKQAEADLAQAFVDLRMTGVEDELQQLGARSGASTKAIEAAKKAAAESYAKGSSQAVAKKAGVGSLSGFVGTDLSKREKDPLMSAIFGTDALPDVPLSQIDQGQQPQVLMATINNTYTINMTNNIEGSRDPGAVGADVEGRLVSLMSGIEKVSKFSKVNFDR